MLDTGIFFKGSWSQCMVLLKLKKIMKWFEENQDKSPVFTQKQKTGLSKNIRHQQRPGGNSVSSNSTLKGVRQENLVQKCFGGFNTLWK